MIQFYRKAYSQSYEGELILSAQGGSDDAELSLSSGATYDSKTGKWMLVDIDYANIYGSLGVGDKTPASRLHVYENPQPSPPQRASPLRDGIWAMPRCSTCSRVAHALDDGHRQQCHWRALRDPPNGNLSSTPSLAILTSGYVGINTNAPSQTPACTASA